MTPSLSLNSVRLRLTLWNVGVMALVLAILGLVLWYGVQANLLSSANRDLTDRAHHFQGRWERDSRRFTTRPVNAPQEQASVNDPSARFRPRLFTRQGTPLRRWMTDAPWNPVAIQEAASGGESLTTVRSGGERMQVFSAPLRQGGQIVAVMQMAYPLGEIDRGLRGLSRTLLTLIPLALLERVRHFGYVVGVGFVCLPASLTPVM